MRWWEWETFFSARIQTTLAPQSNSNKIMSVFNEWISATCEPRRPGSRPGMWIGMRTSWYEEWKRSKAEDKVKAETIIGTSLVKTQRIMKKVLIIIDIDRM